MKKGDLVVRDRISTHQVMSLGSRLPVGVPLLVVKGLHEGSVWWTDRVMSLGPTIDVMWTETGEVEMDQPVSDFFRIPQ